MSIVYTFAAAFVITKASTTWFETQDDEFFEPSVSKVVVSLRDWVPMLELENHRKCLNSRKLSEDAVRSS